MAPAHPHAARGAVYPALFILNLAVDPHLDLEPDLDPNLDLDLRSRERGRWTLT